MVEEISIRIIELAAGNNNQILKTGSVGSCMVVALYDPENKIGGLAHAMLPLRFNREVDSEDLNSAKYIGLVIDNLVKLIKSKGGQVNNMTAKLVGGALMFIRTGVLVWV